MFSAAGNIIQTMDKICSTLFLLMSVKFFDQIQASKQQQGPNLTLTERLDLLFTKPHYDPRLRPNFNYKPVIVTVGFWVLSIDAINVMHMEFGIDIFLRQSWFDPRLDHGLQGTLSLSNTVLSHIWLPDSYFKNAKKASFHDVTTPNIMISIGPGGLVNYNARVTLKASCPMDLHLYPLDVQECPLIIESYGYDIKNIIYKWEKSSEDGMSFVPLDMKMLPQFKLTKLHLSTIFTRYVIGNYSGLRASFSLQRLYSYQVIHLYGPSGLIVVLSWLTFLLPRTQSPARVTLGVTSVLTIVTVLTMSNNAMPKVNYVKAIDKYLIVCFLFVFCSLLEYAIVLLLDRGKRNFEKQKKETRNLVEKLTSGLAQFNGNIKHRHSDIILDDRELRKLLHNGETKSTDQKGDEYAESILEASDSKQACSLSKVGEKWHGVREIVYRETFIAGVDAFSLKLFSFVFVTYNFYYWVTIFYYPKCLI